jgi:predicted nucleic-acid-binding Zn-ribbon protein
MGANNKRLTTAEFINQAQVVHGAGRYDYSRTEYVSSKQNVLIICPKHGEFLQTPSNHKFGKGCVRCSGGSPKGTTASFIAEARAVHGDRYDYSRSVFHTSKTPLLIICSIHGEFEQRPEAHCKLKSGCPRCASMAHPQHQANTTEQFISVAIVAHGAKYDYSLVQYTGSKNRVAIICPRHGSFQQLPQTHLRGGGCPKCGFERTAASRHDTQEGFLTRAFVIHGNKYDYSKTLYEAETLKVTIICPTHGPFEQTPTRHTKGRGCRKCNAIRRGESQKLTTGAFIVRAQVTHGDRYDYSQVVYKNAKAKAIIICNKHGPFTQVAGKHASGDGCPKCGDESASQKLFLSTEQFIKRARAVHGNTYDYSQAIYAGYYERLSIACPAHGLFEQMAGGHLSGAGCLKCVIERHRRGWVAQAKGRQVSLYFLRVYNDTEEFYKVGITIHTVNKRYAGRCGLPGYKYEVLALHKSHNAAAVFDWEQSILETFAYLSYAPRKQFGGASECFSSADEILAIFPL